MKKTKTLFNLFLALILLTPQIVFAHQPRLVDSNSVTVIEPEISKAYYSELSGIFQVYNIKANQPFDLYVNVLVPDLSTQKKDLSVIIIKDNNVNHPIAVLDGNNFAWEKFWEDYGRNWYWKGPEYRAKAEAGNYQIKVLSKNNDSRYSLAIGEAESFGFKEGYNAMRLVPQLKKTFFNESPINFILSPFGWIYILSLLILSFIFGFIYRAIMRKNALKSIRKIPHNIGTKDRLFRALLGILMLLFALATSWHPILIFLAGFCFFETIFSWCGFYAMIGKNSCPLR